MKTGLAANACLGGQIKLQISEASIVKGFQCIKHFC